jgi:hypothetical protein
MADLGNRVLDRLYKLSQIDAEWSVRTEHGFSWWAGDLAQHVWADPPIQRNGHLLTRVHVRTDLVQGFDGTEKQLQVLGLLTRYATLSGWVRHPEDPSRLQFAAAVSVHEDAWEFLTDLLSLAGAIQVAEAHILIPMFEMVDGWTVARSAHPTSGSRHEPDDMLQVVEGLPLREAPSHWAGSEMLQVLGMLQGPPSILANGDENGIAAEFSFPGPRGSSLLRISTTEEHPRLGRGCLFRLTLPPSEARLTSLSDLLETNEREAQGQNYFLGSWCPAEEGPTYVSFIPNAAYRPGALQNVAMSLVTRARWVTAELFDHDIDENYEEAVTRKAAQLRALTESHAERGPTRDPVDNARRPSVGASFHDQVADEAVADGNTSYQFRAAAQKHANAFWVLAFVGIGVWFLAGLWSLIPFGLAALAAAQSVSSTLVARKLEGQQLGPELEIASAPARGLDGPGGERMPAQLAKGVERPGRKETRDEIAATLRTHAAVPGGAAGGTPAPVQPASPSATFELEEEDRVLVFADGEEGVVGVSRIGPGVFRIQSGMDAALLAPEEYIDDAGFGSLVHAEELPDGRLRVTQIARDPLIETYSGVLGFSREFLESEQFRQVSDQIMAAGGNWEWMAGIFSAYVPRDPESAPGFDLQKAVHQAERAWEAAGEV